MLVLKTPWEIMFANPKLKSAFVIEKDFLLLRGALRPRRAIIQPVNKTVYKLSLSNWPFESLVISFTSSFGWIRFGINCAIAA